MCEHQPFLVNNKPAVAHVPHSAQSHKYSVQNSEDNDCPFVLEVVIVQVILQSFAKQNSSNNKANAQDYIHNDVVVLEELIHSHCRKSDV